MSPRLLLPVRCFWDLVSASDLTLLSAPDAPKYVAISNITTNSVDLSWDTPIDNGAKITGYRISGQLSLPVAQPLTMRNAAVQEGGAGGFVEYIANTHSNKTTFTVRGLLPGGYGYDFQVQAYNRIGMGEPSPASAIAITSEINLRDPVL